MNEILPVFVVGCPRTGTTLIGKYLGSSPIICDLQEYSGFFFAHYTAPMEFYKVPTPYKEQYLNEIQKHSLMFAEKITRASGKHIYCDSTPWNLLILNELVNKLPNSIYILLIRHYSGVIQSLKRSFNSGYDWAGENLELRAQLWNRFYSKVRLLPKENTIVLSYDKLCSDPYNTINEFKDNLKLIGINIDSIGFDELAKSHATKTSDSRTTIATKSVDGKISLHPIPSYSKDDWNESIQQKVYPIVKHSDNLLKELYHNTYVKPKDFLF